MRKRAIITLALGSQYYYRMALALMISAHRFGKERYEYIIFTDKDKLPYYQVPEWIKVVNLSNRYHQSDEAKSWLHESFRIKSKILADDLIKNYDTLFLDADCYIFEDCFESIFTLIEENSMAIYGDYLPKGELWGKIDFCNVAAKAGYKVNNMWLNSGFIGRAADETGHFFVRKYGDLMQTYPYKPFIASKFWQAADEPYLATAYQIAAEKKYGHLPASVSSPASDIYITTYDAVLDTKEPLHPVVHSNYVKGSFQPSIIHFLGGLQVSHYRGLINKTVSFNLEGKLLRPYFRANYTYKRLKYYYKRLTDSTITEARDN
ncbi:hypothetical protein D770_16745 [Flammeovirgaceae bacterium 311]|nr:hypothetical protein D770_16745 [Flammeovirgaceae bacterium 311]